MAPATHLMQITERTSGDVTILDLDGRMTRHDGYGLLKPRVGELTAAGRNALLLNLRGVPYLDSSGVGELVSVFISVRNHGGVLKILGPSERVAHLLAVAKLDTVFEIFDAETAALASFASSPRGQKDQDR